MFRFAWTCNRVTQRLASTAKYSTIKSNFSKKNILGERWCCFSKRKVVSRNEHFLRNRFEKSEMRECATEICTVRNEILGRENENTQGHRNALHQHSSNVIYREVLLPAAINPRSSSVRAISRQRGRAAMIMIMKKTATFSVSVLEGWFCQSAVSSRLMHPW